MSHQHPKQPEEWNKLWNTGGISRMEYHQGLIYSAQFNDIETVLSVLSKNEIEEFRDFLARSTEHGDNEEEWVQFGNPAPWKYKDAEALLNFIQHQ
jgi:hypothetical protein